MLPSTLIFYLLSLLQVSQANVVDVTTTIHELEASRRAVHLNRRSAGHSAVGVEQTIRRRAGERSVPGEGFHNPYTSGGHLLTIIPVTYPMGMGEPINAVISGHSDERVLVNQETNGGLRNYFLSLGFSGNCLGQKQEEEQAANLGDGHGNQNESDMMRWNYGDPQFGTCRETIEGGNHFRYWIQDGPEANTGAVFMAISYEKPISEQHGIVPNGYNLGRDWLLGNITRSPIIGQNITADMNFEGDTSSNNWRYHTTFRYVQGILPNTSEGVNHNHSVPVEGINASDGWLAILDVQIVGEPERSTSSAVKTLSTMPAWQLISSLVVLTSVPALALL